MNRAKAIEENPPVDVDAERALIASILIGSHREPLGFSAEVGDVFKALEPESFVDEGCRAIFSAMAGLHAEQKPPGDITLLVGRLRDARAYDVDNGADAGGLIYLFRLLPHWLNWRHYLARLQEMARRRRAFHRGLQLLDVSTATLPPVVRRATEHAIKHRMNKRARA